MKNIGIYLSIVLSFMEINKVRAQCATCKAAAETSLENGEPTIASGVNLGVLYMLSILFLIFGLFIFVLWKHRNADGHISR